ncbi:MAG: DUF739 family protein [Lachnospiraceae bacterium]|nr:DUF739 family protein [Lachnospiraceae bacterium]
MPFKYKKLRGRIVELYGTQEKFAEEIGISTTTMSKKMKCKSGFSQADMRKWADKLYIKTTEYGEYFFN